MAETDEGIDGVDFSLYNGSSYGTVIQLKTLVITGAFSLMLML